MRKLLGKVAVDSGTLMITDPGYATDKGWSVEDYDKYVCGMKDHSNKVPFKLGHEGKAIIFSSGLGDGMYEVWAEIKKVKGWGERVTEVTIKLI